MADKANSKFVYAVSLAAQLGFLIVAPLTGFIWLGVFIDRFGKTAPLFTLTGLALGLTVTGYETYEMLRPLISADNANRR